MTRSSRQARPKMFRMVVISTALALAVPQVSGCRATALKPSPADSLREQVQSLEIEVDRLSLRNHELEVALEKASSETSSRVIDAEAVAAQPHLVRIGIGSASGVRIGPSDVVDRMLPGSLTVYVEPVDGRGRFLQVTGRVSIQASMPVEGGEPILLGERSFSPIEVRDAWRSGFMGTHYTFEVPIGIPRTALEAVADPQASVLVVLRDAIDGGEFSRLVTVPIDDSASEPRDSRR